ncbi:hypothetical protein QBC38DRAFT_147871 [Podospora fimiseda]|uniref:DNA 3'-5' helicase n=1 Tax=Podospora fimiseda TaxID=252190 RepID=A0AAN7H0Q3_9PEZI|nr:hypothetical protein QBC38DRAFT_147871 [Podospora fimiseda]
MPGQWRPNNPLWKPPSRVRNTHDDPPERMQRPASSSYMPPGHLEEESMDAYDLFEPPLSKPDYYIVGSGNSGTRDQLPRHSQASYRTQVPEYKGRYGFDPRQPVDHDYQFDFPNPHSRGNAQASNFHRSPPRQPVQASLSSTANAGGYFEDAEPSPSHQASFSNLASHSAPRVNRHSGYGAASHAFSQQATPPSLPRRNQSSFADPLHLDNPPQSSSSPTARIGRPNLKPQRATAVPQLAYGAPHSQQRYSEYGDGHSDRWSGSAREQDPYDELQPSRAQGQTHHGLRTQPHLENQVPTPLTSTGPQADGPATPLVHGVRLISLRQALPERFRSLFPYELFNAVQSKCFPLVYEGTDNVVIAAPTGSGKTAILELAICKVALDRGNENYKIVYQAPTKALCYEKARDWEKKFAHMNLTCAELTGDTSQAEMKRVGDASIIVTTPEKWDSITRKWQDHKRLLQLVELFLIDEVHILKDARGATLEAVVSRMKTIGANVRFVALSATVPNSDDIAQWLGRNHTNQHIPAHRETFGEEFRPVKLQKFVYGYDYSGNEYMFDNFLDQRIAGLISRHSQKKPMLIFCFTRKSCQGTAAVLADYASSRPAGDKPWPMPTKRIPVVGRELQELVKFGVAFHHAGLEQQDRMAVEQSFLKGELGVICCTSTLAVGINLPCHTVFLKGTVGFSDDKVQEYCDLEVMQMLGRAGRPQFDDSAIAVILTRRENKNRYEKMVSGQEILESTLHLNLIEHLNSEICLGTIHNLQSGKTWLSGTFLSVRLRRNPNYYRLTDSTSNPDQIDDKLAEICERDIKELQSVDLITNGETFKCTEYGVAMSKYLVEFATMKMLLRIPRAAKMESLITVISQATEFKEFRLKPTERNLFREINQSQLILYPVKEAITQNWHKISLIVQAQLGCVQYPDSPEVNKLKRQLASERKAIFERFNRLIRAVIDCKAHDGDSVSLKSALELARSLSAEAWEGRATQLTQVPNIGPVGMRKLQAKGVKTILDLADKEPQDIERYMSRNPPFGSIMLASLDKFPRLDLDLVVVGHKIQRSGAPTVHLEMKAVLRYLNRKGVPTWRNRSPSLTFLAESSDGVVGFFWRGNIRKLEPYGLELKFTVPLHDTSHTIACHFSCEEIVGTNVSKAVHHNIPASAFPKPSKPAPTQVTKKTPDVGSFMDDDGGIDDRDLLGLADNSDMAHPTTAFTTEPLLEPDFEDFPSIEDLLEMEEAELDFNSNQTFTPAPVQLPNGKWRCNHVCTGEALTKNGKACNHRCCKEGIDKPRKRSNARPKRNADNEGELLKGMKGGDLHSNQTSGKSNPQKRVATQDSHERTKRAKFSTMRQPKEFEKMAGPENIGLRGAQGASDWKPSLVDDMDVECIDLSLSDEEVGIMQGPALGADKSWRGNINNTLEDEGDDCILLDDLDDTATRLSKHFKAGATDSVLYEGISNKFEKAKEASQSGQIEKLYGLNWFEDDDDEIVVYPSSPPMFVEQAPGLPGRSSTQDSTMSKGAADENDEVEADSANREEDPPWLSQMQLDADSMELVNSLRGYVTFV